MDIWTDEESRQAFANSTAERVRGQEKKQQTIEKRLDKIEEEIRSIKRMIVDIEKY